MPHVNRLSYRCAADRDHLSEMGREALYCEMSGGDGVASDLVGWLNTEELWPKRKLVGQHARPILQLRWAHRYKMLVANCTAPNRASIEWHLKSQNVAECGQWIILLFFLSFCSLSFVFFPLRRLSSHHSNIAWQRKCIVMSHCDRSRDEKWDVENEEYPNPKRIIMLWSSFGVSSILKQF